MAALDDEYEGSEEGGMDDALDEVDPDELQPPSEEEADQDDYAGTDQENV